MTGKVRFALAAGGVYAGLFVLATALLPAPFSASTRLILGHVALLLPALAALLAAFRAARASLGAERAFWSLIAGAAVAQMAAEAAFLIHALVGPDMEPLLGVGLAGRDTFYVLVAVAVLVCPHRPLGTARLRAAIVEWTMVAVAAYFLLLYFLALPLGEGATPWFWIFTLQQLVPAAGFAVLAFTVPSAPFATVYRILAVGLGAAAAAGVVPNWREATGPHEAYSAASLPWVLTLLALAVAACADRGSAWVPGRDEDEAGPRRGWAMAAIVVLPLGLDQAMRILGADPLLADARAQLALAVTGVLLALTAIRVRRAAAGPSGREAAMPPAGTSEYVHFATGIAHELNNPLMAVGGWAELALRKSEPRESLEALLEATRRATLAVRRLQQLGRAADAPPASAPPPEDGHDASLPDGTPARSGTTSRRLALGTLAFAAVYYAVTWLGAPRWTGEALLLLPPAAAASAAWKRARAASSGRRAAFWKLLAAGAGLWIVGEVTWIAFGFTGLPPQHAATRVLGLLFLGFLVPILTALGLRAHPRAVRKDAAAWPDAALLAAAVLYVFVRLPVVSALALGEPLATKRVLLGSLTAAVTVWAAILWRFTDDPSWRRTYGAVSVFALSYGSLAVFANGLIGRMPAPGGWTDLAWFLPFAFLLAAAGPGRPGALSAYPALLIAGTGPLFLDLALHDRLSPGGPGRALAPACALLLAVAAAVRLRWQVDVDRGARKEARLQTDESQRAGRLTALASLVAAAVGELEDLLEDVSRRARAASVVMPDKGEQMLQQARRARDIVRDLSNAFRLVPPGPRRDLDVVSLVEEVVEAALDEGLALHVSLEDLAGLPMIHGDPRALSAAVSHVLRNAAQASPGGILRIRGALREGAVELSFADDGPGVPEAVRAQIFDPFFTTRRVGEGVGLGLTLVHFVARGHGGSIVLSESTTGACFALRLPARPSSGEPGALASWPFAAAALVSGAVAIVMAVEPAPDRRAILSIGFQIASAVLAAGAMGTAAARQAGSRRWFWSWMAAGAGIWALTRGLRVLEGGATGRPSAGVWPLVLFAIADLTWAAALLLRPDRRRERPSSRLGLSAGAALVLFAYAHAHLVVLPDPFALTDVALRDQLVFVRALQKVALAIWAGVLSWRALTPYWRGFYARLSAVLGTWAVGQTIAFAHRSRPDYVAGGASDLGWIIPFLCLAALALHEAARTEVVEEPSNLGDRRRTHGSAAWLVALAGIVAFDSLFAATSGYAALDLARARLTHVMVVVMALLLAAREVLLAREGQRVSPARFPRDAGPSRWARLAASAVHELGSNLSSISALARLLLSQPDASPRARADMLRLHDRTEAATRVVRNLLAALPASFGGRERTSVNRVVEEALLARRPALEADGIAIVTSLAGEVPEIPVDAAALRHVVSALLDRAAVATRGVAGRGAAQVEVATAVRGDAVLVTVGDNGLVTGGAVLQRLLDAIVDSPEPRVDSDLQKSVVRESIERQGGSLAIGPRPGGGTEFVIRLPIPAAFRPAADGGAAPETIARRSGTH